MKTFELNLKFSNKQAKDIKVLVFFAQSFFQLYMLNYTCLDTKIRMYNYINVQPGQTQHNSIYLCCI